MRRLLVVLAVLLTFSSSACREELGYTELVWHDEFDDGAFTMGHWRLGPDPGVRPPPGSVTLTPEGTLLLKIGENTNYNWTNVSTMGPWRNSPEPNYYNPTVWQKGFFEARIRFSDSEWIDPAFWLFSANTQEAYPGKCDGGSGLLTSEIDVLDAAEFSGIPRPSDHYFGGIHRNTWAGTVRWCEIDDEVQTTHLDMGVNLSEWHVWGAEWTDDKVNVFLDGELITAWDTYDSTAQPMSALLSLNYGPCETCGPKPSELTLEVDYVRVWNRPA